MENEISSKAAETGERAVDAIIDDQVYASSSKSFRLERSSEEPVAAAKRFSIPERIPYCVSGEPFAIIAAGEKGQSVLLPAFMNASRDGCISLATSGQPPDDLQHPSYPSALDEVDTHMAFQ